MSQRAYGRQVVAQESRASVRRATALRQCWRSLGPFANGRKQVQLNRRFERRRLLVGIHYLEKTLGRRLLRGTGRGHGLFSPPANCSISSAGFVVQLRRAEGLPGEVRAAAG